MMLSAFLAMRAASPGGDDERVVRLLDELPEVGGAAAPGPRDRFGDASLVDAETALHPVDLAPPAAPPPPSPPAPSPWGSDDPPRRRPGHARRWGGGPA